VTSKSMDYYLGLPWTYYLETRNDDGVYCVAYINELDGCISHGASPEEAVINIREALQAYINSCLKHGDSIPEPLKKEDYKGQISYRTKPEKHYRLAMVAQRRGKSINKLIDEAIDKVIDEAS
jgi:predicted RNase H-like HicB family nuclease